MTCSAPEEVAEWPSPANSPTRLALSTSEASNHYSRDFPLSSHRLNEDGVEFFIRFTGVFFLLIPKPFDGATLDL